MTFAFALRVIGFRKLLLTLDASVLETDGSSSIVTKPAAFTCGVTFKLTPVVILSADVVFDCVSGVAVIKEPTYVSEVMSMMAVSLFSVNSFGRAKYLVSASDLKALSVTDRSPSDRVPNVNVLLAP